MKYRLYYAEAPFKLLGDPNLASYGLYFTIDKNHQFYSMLDEQQAIILKLKYPYIKLHEV